MGIGQFRAQEGWIILRTSGRNTLKLAEQLIREGFDAWAPARTLRKRVPRKNEVYEITAPLLPSFAFAKADHVTTLLALEAEPMKPCPDFTVFRFLNEVPVIGSHELAPLRRLEESEQRRLEVERLRCKRREVKFQPGQNIRIDVGPFSGMSGPVRSDDGRYTSVDLGFAKPVKFSTFILTGDNIILSPQPTAKAA